MRTLLQGAASGRRAFRLFASTCPSSSHGRTAAYRRLHTDSIASCHSPISTSSLSYPLVDASSSQTFLRSPILPQHLLPLISQTSSRRWVSYRNLKKDAGSKEEAKKEEPKVEARPKTEAREESRRPQTEPEGASTENLSEAEKAYQKFRAKADEEESKWRAQNKKAEREQEESEEGGEKNKEEKKPPPPPPHGSKTPWQVFTETLSTEFKASKEWNESTKQLASSAHDFTQNETVKRARDAYKSTADTAGTVTSAVIGGTGKAIGKSAAWTWDTHMVRGLRKGVGAVGGGIEKATRPLRETEAYKNVKSTIDDGSSSRYGGWSDREERRARREKRELEEERRTGRRPGRPTEKHDEDPK